MDLDSPREWSTLCQSSDEHSNKGDDNEGIEGVYDSLAPGENVDKTGVKAKQPKLETPQAANGQRSPSKAAMQDAFQAARTTTRSISGPVSTICATVFDRGPSSRSTRPGRRPQPRWQVRTYGSD